MHIRCDNHWLLRMHFGWKILTKSSCIVSYPCKTSFRQKSFIHILSLAKVFVTCVITVQRCERSFHSGVSPPPPLHDCPVQNLACRGPIAPVNLYSIESNLYQWYLFNLVWLMLRTDVKLPAISLILLNLVMASIYCTVYRKIPGNQEMQLTYVNRMKNRDVRLYSDICSTGYGIEMMPTNL